MSINTIIIKNKSKSKNKNINKIKEKKNIEKDNKEK